MIIWRRLIVSWLSLTLAICISGCASAASSKENSNSQKPNKIIAIGDLHGDYAAYLDLLQEAGLINKKGKWTGGETTFVQLGDIADRGPDSRKIIEHIIKLQKQARKKGGDIIALVGNHEAMNMTKDLRYVHKGEYAAFATKKSRRIREKIYQANIETIESFYLQQDDYLISDEIKKKWKTANPLGKFEHQIEWAATGDIGEWVVSNPAIAIVDGTLFVHGGLSAKYTQSSLDEMNERVKAALIAGDENPANIINDEWGPLWYRGYIPGYERPDCDENIDNCLSDHTQEQELDLVLTHFGADRMVVGHTPALKGIKASYDGKLLQIDTGIAPYYGGTRSFLRIENGELFAHDNGSVRPLRHLIQ